MAGRGRTVKFALGEDTDVSTVMCWIDGRSSEYRAVKKAQIFFKWVRDREPGHHRVLDHSTVLNELICLTWLES